MKLIIVFLSMLLFINWIPTAFSEELEVFTNSQVYSEGQPLFVYGNALPYENLILRLFAPDGTIATFEQVLVESDGSFNYIVLTWPDTSTKFPYGTYTLEALSTEQNGISRTIDVKFTSTTELQEVPVERILNTIVFAPETAAVNQPFRVFAQVTSDGQLVGGNAAELLETSHVHTPAGQVENLVESFDTLHPGLYFVDYNPRTKGTYVFHVVAFTQGTISHGSAATQVLSQDISGVAEQVIKLNTILDETSDELNTLKTEVSDFGATLQGASDKIDQSVTSISSSVTNIEEASIQLNSLFFPIVASIGIIVALQIAILARRR